MTGVIVLVVIRQRSFGTIAVYKLSITSRKNSFNMSNDKKAVPRKREREREKKITKGLSS